MRIMMIICTFGWLVSGCAFTDVQLELPATGFDLPTTQLGEPVSGPDAREVIVVVPFVDERGIDRCGMKKNGYNQDTADVICDSDPSAWLAQLLAERLSIRSHVVLREEAGAVDRGSDPLRVEGTLIQLFVEPVIGAWVVTPEIDLSARLLATTKSGLQAERTFFVKGWKASALATQEDNQTALRRATAVILDEMVAAIEELLERYPEIGTSPSTTMTLPSGEA